MATTMPKRPVFTMWLLFAVQLAVIFQFVKSTSKKDSSNGQIISDEKDIGNKSTRKSNIIIGTLLYDLTGFSEDDYFNGSIHTSPLVYVMVNDNVYNDTCGFESFAKFGLRCGPHYGITSLSFLISPENVKHVAKMETSRMTNKTIINLVESHGNLINSIIISFNLFDNKHYCECVVKPNHISEYLTDELRVRGSERLKFNSSVSFGLEYDEDVIDCCFHNNFNIFGFLDLAVFRVEISPFTTLLSYGLFSRKLDALVQKNRNFAFGSNPGCALFFRLVFLRYTNVSDEVNDRYQSLITEYTKAWKEDHKLIDIKFIVSSFPLNVSVQDNTDFLSTNVGPTINLALCEQKPTTTDWIKAIPPLFTNIPIQLVKNCQSGQDLDTWTSTMLGPIAFHTKANLSIIPRYGFLSGFPTDLIRVLVTKADLLNIRTFYLDSGTNKWDTAEFNDIVQLIQSKNIQIGCLVYLYSDDLLDRNNGTTLVESIKGQCDRLLNYSSKIQYTLNDFAFLNTEKDFIDFLWNLAHAQQVIQENFPGKEPFPYIWLNSKDYNHGRVSVFCTEYKQTYNENYNAITTFANIHKWKYLQLRYLNTFDVEFLYAHSNWWQNVATTPDVNREITDFSLVVHTNAAKQMAKEKQFPNKYPCVDWTGDSPKWDIGFLKNSFSGTTVLMDLKEKLSLDAKELETMLLFAFGKFPTVELIAKSENDVNLTTDVLTGSLLKIVRSQNNVAPESGHLVYLELPIDMAYNSTALKKLSTNVAVHFAGWENHTKSNLDIQLDAFANSHYFGITIANCAQELNFNLTRLLDLPLLPFVKYVVCDVTPVEPDNYNQNSMDLYLSTMFYIKSYMEKFAPERSVQISKLEVIFRLNFKQGYYRDNKGIREHGILRFVNDVYQHSKAYKMRFFIINAFSQENYQDDYPKTWWLIENYTDLSNTSVYTDIEEEHFGRPTKIKFERPSDALKNDESKGVNLTVIAATTCVLSFLLFISLLTLWLYHKRTRKLFLTQPEINEFFNGVLSNNAYDEQEKDNSTWLGMGFPKSFQIPKKRIVLGKLVGSGEFGLVFAGMLDEQTAVAVKVPRPNAPSELFKSALSEVKILCFVGDGTHPNVISFLGAYVNEISRGKLYILTEYCPTGSLLAYLRATQVEIREGANTSVDLYQLYRFAFEIASGMEYVSSKRVIHGDLAARNILLNSDYTCKICDFGLSRKLYEYTEYVKKSTEPLPWRWMAIESLKSMEFTTKSDVWSYGITTWEIFSLGAQPYPGLSWTPGYVNDLENGMRLEKADYASDEIHEKLLECWRVSPDSRPTFGELAQYFTELRSDVYTACHDVNPTNSNKVKIKSVE